MMILASFIVAVLAAPSPPSAATSAAGGKPDSSAGARTPEPAIPDLVAALRALVAGKESAIDDLEKLNASRPKDPRVLFALGTAHKLAGKSEAALRHFRAAADIARAKDGIHAARPWWGLVRLYREAGLEKEAAAALKSFVGVAAKLKGLEAIVKRAEEDLKKPRAP